MMLYTIGDYTISADLLRYSRQMSIGLLKPEYELGFCTVEHIPADMPKYKHTPILLDVDKPFEKLEYNRNAELSGHLGLQKEVHLSGVDLEASVSWLSVKIDAPNGDVDALIEAYAKKTNPDISDKDLTFVKERFLVKKSTPTNSNAQTVAALIRNTGAIRAERYYKQRVSAIGKSIGVSDRLAEFLVFADREGGFITAEEVENAQEWHPKNLFLSEPATTAELDSLVDKGYFELVNESEYRNTELANKIIEEKLPLSNSIYLEAIKTFGEPHQIQKAIGECGELVAELVKYFTDGKSNLDEVAQEIADVEIMMGQLRLMIGTYRVEEAKAFKLKRLKLLIAEAKKPC